MRNNAYLAFGLVLIFVLMALIGIVKSGVGVVHDNEMGPPAPTIIPDQTCLDGKLWHADHADKALSCVEIAV